jgi:hypothetical protein
VRLPERAGGGGTVRALLVLKRVRPCGGGEGACRIRFPREHWEQTSQGNGQGIVKGDHPIPQAQVMVDNKLMDKVGLVRCQNVRRGGGGAARALECVHMCMVCIPCKRTLELLWCTRRKTSAVAPSYTDGLLLLLLLLLMFPS